MSSLPKLGLALVVALLVAVPVALAAEATDPARIRRRVEPICKANTEANSRILKGVKEQVKQDEAGAGRQALHPRLRRRSARRSTQIAKVPQPEADAAKLTKWIGYLKQREDLPAADRQQALKAKDKYHAQKLAVELNKNNNKANNTVISFGFKECRIDSSRFI